MMNLVCDFEYRMCLHFSESSSVKNAEMQMQKGFALRL